MPRIRAQPEDFVVEELPLFPPTGEGTHTHLWIEKRLRTTDDVARDLARAVGVPPREVGYAGRKDRHAVTRQWFSVPELAPEQARGLELPDARVLDAVRHTHRLRVGQLRGNRFRLRVREVDAEDAERAAERLDELRRRGLPNRFGRQRFGRDGGNVARGTEMLRGGRLRGDRRQALLMISALQSAVFNQVLDARADSYDRLLEGDVAMTHATGLCFPVREPEAETERLASFEVSPTGPIFGTKMQRPRGAAAAIEDAAMARFDLPPASALALPRELRLHGGRRPLRIRLEDVRSDWDDGVMGLDFTLPAGSYATILVAELFPGKLEEGTNDLPEDADEAH
ncbi:MAG TPA: tRNA pseudouridine(13) synthase TruD [Thermoanaerobaculia bacterium]